MPRSSIEPPTLQDTNIIYKVKSNFKSIDTFIIKIEKLRKYLKEQLLQIQSLQAEQANKKKYLALKFKVRDIIILNARNIKTI